MTIAKSLPFFAGALCVSCVWGPSSAQEVDANGVVTPTEGVIEIFDGESLDNFYTWMSDSKYEDPRQVFRITDGMLHVTGDGVGGILTRDEYRDYHLVLECKWGPRTWRNRVKSTKDSGLLIHSVGKDGDYGNMWMPAIEVQMIEGGFGDFILVVGHYENGERIPFSITCETTLDRDGETVWNKGGKRQVYNWDNRPRINWYGRDPDWEDKLGFRGKEDLESPDGEWTRMDVICDGSHIEVYINGVMANEAFDSFPTHGKLQLQTELAEVFIRRWELWPVGKGPKPAKAVD